MSVYILLFVSFFKIGLFGFGGGYAILSLIQFEVVEKYGWINMAEFADIVAISQTTPGAISINCATYAGYEVGGILGSIVATLSVCLPSFIIIITISRLFSKFKDNLYVNDAMKILRPAIVGLIAAAALLLMTKNTFSDYTSYIIFAVALLLQFWKKTNRPILIIITAGIIGCIIY